RRRARRGAPAGGAGGRPRGRSAVGAAWAGRPRQWSASRAGDIAVGQRAGQVGGSDGQWYDAAVKHELGSGGAAVCFDKDGYQYHCSLNLWRVPLRAEAARVALPEEPPVEEALPEKALGVDRAAAEEEEFGALVEEELGVPVEAEVEGAVKMAGPPPEAPLEERQAGTWLDATVLRIHANFMVVGARRPGSADDVRGLVHFSRVPAEHAAGRLADHYSVGQSVRVRMVDAGAREESSDIRQMWMGGPPDLDALERARAEGLWLNATVVRVEQYGLHVQVVPPGSQSCHQAPSQMPCRITAWCTSRRFNTGSGVQYEAQSGLLHGQPARPRRPRASQGSQPDALPYHGLVHISEIKYGFVQDISAVAEVGDTVRVRVTGLDRDTGRVNLSMRASLEIFEQFGADEWIDATVFNVSDRVVEVQARLPGDDSGVASGIVPSRELRAGPVQSAMGAAEVGDTVRVRLINATGRFGPVFSMKPRPDVSAFAGVPPEALLPAFVVAVLDDSHIFVSVPPPTDAGEPAEGKVRGVVAAEYQPGQMVQVRVSDVNVERGLLTLTLGGLT
ncbi:unnamed protein product, partial [Prorocentrum cordatum]